MKYFKRLNMFLIRFIKNFKYHFSFINTLYAYIFPRICRFHRKFDVIQPQRIESVFPWQQRLVGYRLTIKK